MREILTSIRRTPYQSLAAFLILFFTLFLSTIMFVGLAFLYALLGYVETKPQVTVYFQSKTIENDIFKLKNELLQSGKVDSIKYISKLDAFKIYKDLNKDNPLLLEMVSPEILPASLEIYAKKPQYLPQIADFLKKQKGVDEVNFQKNIVDRLLLLTNVLRKVSLVFFAFLILVSFLVLNTITLFKIALKKEEIEVLRLLGATTLYIQKPFLLEGALFGLAASIGSFVLILLIALYLHSNLQSYLFGVPYLAVGVGTIQLNVWPLNIIFFIITFLLSSLFGVGIAILSTLLATRKYIKI